MAENRETSRAWLEGPDDAGTVSLGGDWTIRGLRDVDARLRAIRGRAGLSVLFDGNAITDLDTAGAWLLVRVSQRLEREGAQTGFRGLESSRQALLALVTEARTRQPGEIPRFRPPGLFEHIGQAVVDLLTQGRAFLDFVGRATTTAFHMLRHPQRMRGDEFFHALQTAGFDALAISGLLSFLLGIVIAYQGATLLQRYGAEIFVVDLVALSMVRELSPLIVAIILAGRTGSAYTAEIGTMQVTEEVDALTVIGIPPMEILVLPKIFALLICVPLLIIFCDLMGILGGLLVTALQLNIGFSAFVDRLEVALDFTQLSIGVIKAPVFAAIVGLVGCFQGFQVRGSAASVGRHTTMSVVQSIFLVIVADALFSILFNELDI